MEEDKEKWSKFKTYRIIDGKSRKVIVDLKIWYNKKIDNLSNIK